MNDVASATVSRSPLHSFALEYSGKLFVERDETKLVMAKVRDLTLGTPPRERVIIIRGQKGSGKTWLLRHLAEMLGETPGVTPSYLDLNLYAGQEPDMAIAGMLRAAAEKLPSTISARAIHNQAPEDIPVRVKAGWFIEDVFVVLQERVLVLLLDHVYESSETVLDALETLVLSHLVAHPRVLTVMTGRAATHTWRIPELRLYFQDIVLKPFTEPQTKDQLSSLSKEHPSLLKEEAASADSAQTIHDISQGYPLVNYLLASQGTLVQGLGESVAGLLEGIGNDEREYLEALCIVRAFYDEHIPVLLAVRKDDSSVRNWPQTDIRSVRNRLLATRLVHWDENSGGWTIDAALRPILAKYLYENETSRPCWKKLHCAAYRLYQRWVEVYPDERSRWTPEAEYHAQCLRDVGYDPEQCPKD